MEPGTRDYLRDIFVAALSAEDTSAYLGRLPDGVYSIRKLANAAWVYLSEPVDIQHVRQLVSTLPNTTTDETVDARGFTLKGSSHSIKFSVYKVSEDPEPKKPRLQFLRRKKAEPSRKMTLEIREEDKFSGKYRVIEVYDPETGADFVAKLLEALE